MGSACCKTSSPCDQVEETRGLLNSSTTCSKMSGPPADVEEIPERRGGVAVRSDGEVVTVQPKPVDDTVNAGKHLQTSSSYTETMTMLKTNVPTEANQIAVSELTPAQVDTEARGTTTKEESGIGQATIDAPGDVTSQLSEALDSPEQARDAQVDEDTAEAPVESVVVAEQLNRDVIVVEGDTEVKEEKGPTDTGGERPVLDRDTAERVSPEGEGLHDSSTEAEKREDGDRLTPPQPEPITAADNWAEQPAISSDQADASAKPVPTEPAPRKGPAAEPETPKTEDNQEDDVPPERPDVGLEDSLSSGAEEPSEQIPSTPGAVAQATTLADSDGHPVAENEVLPKPEAECGVVRNGEDATPSGEGFSPQGLQEGTELSQKPLGDVTPGTTGCQQVPENEDSVENHVAMTTSSDTTAIIGDAEVTEHRQKMVQKVPESSSPSAPPTPPERDSISTAPEVTSPTEREQSPQTGSPVMSEAVPRDDLTQEVGQEGPHTEVERKEEEPKESVPKDSVPKESISRDSVPKDSVHKDSVPKESVPKESVPKDSVPKESVPKDSVPKESISKDSVPKDSVPKDSVHKDSVPKESVPKESVHKESVPKESVSKDSVPKDSVHKDSVPKESVPKESVPKDSVPKESISKDSVPKESVPKESVPKDSVPKESISKDSVPKDSVSKDSVSKDSVSMDSVSMEASDKKATASAGAQGEHTARAERQAVKVEMLPVVEPESQAAREPSGSDEDMYRGADEIEQDHEKTDRPRPLMELTIRGVEDRCSLAPPINILCYSEREWRGNTTKSTTVRKGYAMLAERFDALRRVRGDNYCALRATLYQLLNSTSQLPHWLQDDHFLAWPDELESRDALIGGWVFPGACKREWCSETEVEMLKRYLKLLQRRWHAAVAAPGPAERECVCEQVFQGADEEYGLLEAMKFLMLARAVGLHDDMQEGRDVPLFCWLLFARDSSPCPRTLLRNHLSQVGFSGGVEQVEMFLLGYALQHTIQAFRLYKADTEEFITQYPNDHLQDWPTVSLVTEDDRHYNVPVGTVTEPPHDNDLTVL